MAWSHLLQSLKSIRWHFILSIKILDILTRPPSSSTLMISSFRGSFSNSSLSNTKMDQLSTLKSLEFTTNVFSCGIREIEIPSLYSNVKSTMLLWIRSLFLFSVHKQKFAICSPNEGLDSFTTNRNSPNAVFTVSSNEILSITVVQPPSDATSYVAYLRAHDIAIHHQTIEVIVKISAINWHIITHFAHCKCSENPFPKIWASNIKDCFFF